MCERHRAEAEQHTCDDDGRGEAPTGEAGEAHRALSFADAAARLLDASGMRVDAAAA